MQGPEMKRLALDVFFDHTPDLICVAGKDGYFKKINRAVADKLGYTIDELMQQPIARFIYADDLEITTRARQQLLNGESLVNFQNRYLKKSGGYVWLEWTSVYFPEQELVFAIAKDITVRKNAELEIRDRARQLQSVAGLFKQKLEHDRHHFAHELHEQLAQLTAVLALNLQQLAAGEAGLSAAGQQQLQYSRSVCEMLVQTIRRISFAVSPGMLNDLGLVASLQWHCHEFSAQSGIACDFSGGCNEAQLPIEKQIDVYRICQDALQNVLHHAHATKASVTLSETATHIRLEVADNGTGFDISMQSNKLGLQLMRSRAATIHATIHISSQTGKGTRLLLELPK